MPPEIEALIDKPFSLAVVLAVGALIGMTVESFAMELRRRAWRKRNPDRWKNGERPRRARPREVARTRTRDAADQLRTVMLAKFVSQPLLNYSESRVFRDLDRMVLNCNPDWRVMAQVSLGEILQSEDKEAFLCVNAKRVDMLLVDANYQPRHVIEYQGAGHYQDFAAARDAVKKEALRQAGIGYHEVIGGQSTREDLGRLVEKLVIPPRPPADNRVVALPASKTQV